MSEPRGTPEASMEEILASIRRIISEDGSSPVPQPVTLPAATRPPVAPIPPASPMPPATSATAPPPPAASVPSPPPVPQPVRPEMPPEPTSVQGILGDRPPVDGEALVLTQMLAEDGSVVAVDRPAGDAAPAAAVASVERSNSRPLDVLLLTDTVPPRLPEVGMAPTPAPPQMSIPPQAPMASSNAPVSAETLIQSNPMLTQLARSRARDGSPTLEELVRQSLEPKVQEWLNANLKDIVERLVQQEIERIRQRTE
jgi:uncharacterized protein